MFILIGIAIVAVMVGVPAGIGALGYTLDANKRARDSIEAAKVAGLAQQAAEAANAAMPEAFSSVSNVRDKANLTPTGETIIGLRDPVLTVNSSEPLAVTDFDTTTYGDRAIIKLTNASGLTSTLTGLAVKGKMVLQLAGQNGYVWEYSDYDAIEKEGEKFVEVSNDFIFDPIQAKQIGDFVWKELKPHKMYSLALLGCHYEYEIGDVYHLTLQYSLPTTSLMEDIDTDVEVIGVSLSRDAGGMGSTQLSLRVPSSAWELTVAKNSKLVGAGRPQWLNNRSNVVTVAASSWTGQADYFCDGVDDNVEIQSVIDYMKSKSSGGTIQLTNGQYFFSDKVIIESNISIVGTGNSTILCPYDNSVLTMFDFGTSSGSTIESFLIHGNSVQFSNSEMNIILGNGNCIASNVTISNYDASNSSGNIYIYAFRNISAIACSCNYNYVTNTASSIVLVCFGYCNNVISCISNNNTSYGSNSYISCFLYSKNISSCISHTNSSNGENIYSFNSCTEISSCSSYNNTTTGSGADMFSYRYCDNMSSCVSYSNSATGTGGDVRSFDTCKRLTVCSTNSNASSLATEYGFFACNSVQQCKSSGDSTPYSGSYADAGLSFPCADTAAGGYNS